MATRFIDFYDREEEVYSVLNIADINARSDRAREFVSDMKEKFHKHGMETFCSEAQYQWLENLAND